MCVRLIPGALLWQEVLRSLYPGCPFEREVVGLELVHLVLSELLPAGELDASTQSNATLSKVKIHGVTNNRTSQVSLLLLFLTGAVFLLKTWVRRQRNLAYVKQLALPGVLRWLFRELRPKKRVTKVLVDCFCILRSMVHVVAGCRRLLPLLLKFETIGWYSLLLPPPPPPRRWCRCLSSAATGWTPC